MSNRGEIKEGSHYKGCKVVRVLHKHKSPNKNSRRHVIFRCTCGEDYERALHNQDKSKYKVCNSCTIKMVAKNKVLYRDERHSRDLYCIWKGMNRRCHKKQSQNYSDYGGRGIHVCEGWRDTLRSNYYNFLDHVYPRPSKKHSLERLDNNKGYFPENVEWKDSKTQMNNVRSNHIIMWENKNYTLQELSEKVGIKANTLLYRLRRGWELEEAILGKRVLEYKRPYAGKVTDEIFYRVLSSLIKGDITNNKAGELLGVGLDGSNISRVKRDKRVIEWLEQYEKRL